MNDLTLEQIFGSGVSQNSSTLTIQKSSLPKLSITANNRSEQLLIALILKAHENFEGMLTDEFSNPVTDENNQPITHNNSALHEKLNIYFWKRNFLRENAMNYCLDTFVLEIYLKPPTEAGILLDPDLLAY